MSTKTQEPLEQKPSRPLHEDFTTYTLKHASVARRRAIRRRKFTSLYSATNKEHISMRILHKPLFATLAAVAAIGISGTTYAAVNGGLSNITALFGGEHKISGARIVKVDLQNCHDRNAFNIVGGTGEGNTPRYYQVTDSAHITNQQMTTMAQSICRAIYTNPDDQALLSDIESHPQNKDLLKGNAEGVITNITTHSIDIQISKEAAGSSTPYVEHFTQLDPNLVVLDGTGVAKNISALHAGDHIYSQYRAPASDPTESESTPLSHVDWSAQTLVTITKRTPDQAAYDQYQQLTQSKKVQQVAPCDHSTTGYCTYDELHS